MKGIINNKLFILIVSVSLYACAQDKVDYREFYHLKGNVKNVTKISSSETNSILGLINTFQTDKEVMTFNEDGQLIKIETLVFNKNSNSYNIADLETFTYKDGLLEYEETIGNAEEPKSKYLITKHNSKGFPLEVQMVEGNTIDRIVYSYNSNTFEKLSFDKDLAIDRYIATYDDNRNVVNEKLEWLYEDSNSPTTYIRTIKYVSFDSKGNWIKRISKEEKTESSIVEERELTYF